MNSSKPTIHDVAKHAGVSKSTVSRVTQSDPRVSESTREKVLAVIEDLGYVPTAAARNLRLGQAPTIGLLISAIDIPIFGRLQMELDDYLAALGYQIIQVVIHNSDLEPQRRALLKLQSMQVQGLVVACGSFNSELLEEFSHYLHILVVGRPETSPMLHNVAYDEKTHGKLLAQAVYEAGHREVFIQTVPPHRSLGSFVRSQQAINTAEELGMKIHTTDIFSINKNYSPFVDQVLDSDATAVMCIFDKWAIETWKAVTARGLSIPEDLSVTGTDGASAVVELLSIATIVKPVQELAQLSARTMVEIIEGKHAGHVVRHSLVGEFSAGKTLGTIRHV